jgi:EAL domain-containing protein (putative c-di-GMP-specific phosphodiesterase class I)
MAMATGPALVYGELSFPIYRNRCNVGRRNLAAGAVPTVDLSPLDRDRVVSRNHAEIVHRDGRLYLLEVGARNGLFVNGERLKSGAERLLSESDQVSFGGVALTFTWQGSWPDGLEAEWAQVGLFETRTEVTTTAASTVSGQLHQAIERNQLLLHYQPKVTLATGKLEAAECLLRWNHPSGQMVYPDSFISLAEHTGYIRAITTWVLENALRQLAAWRNAGLDIHIAVNISTRDLDDDHLAERIAGLLATTGVDARDLIVEVTETGVMSNPQRALENLGRLKATRVKISIDDFGIGQSSLAYLRQVPADELKIDKSFCMALDSNNLAILRSAINVGHDLGMRVIAEGVETSSTLGVLKDLGCDVGQGWLFGKPMLPDTFYDSPLALKLMGRAEPTLEHNLPIRR